MKRNRLSNNDTAKNRKSSRVKKEHVLVESVDKRVARAIRNREAAMKSRVEAKQKLRHLQDENGSLTVRIKTLLEDNLALTHQLNTLMNQTFNIPLVHRDAHLQL